MICQTHSKVCFRLIVHFFSPRPLDFQGEQFTSYRTNWYNKCSSVVTKYRTGVEIICMGSKYLPKDLK